MGFIGGISIFIGHVESLFLSATNFHPTCAPQDLQNMGTMLNGGKKVSLSFSVLPPRMTTFVARLNVTMSKDTDVGDRNRVNSASGDISGSILISFLL